MNIKRLVDSLVRKYKSRNPFEIIEHFNVIVVFYPLHGVKGFYQYFQRNNIIYIDETLSDKEKLFVCRHELGHMFLHKKANAIFMDSRTQLNTTKYEIEADRFAMNLLLSDADIEEHLDFSTTSSHSLLNARNNNFCVSETIFFPFEALPLTCHEVKPDTAVLFFIIAFCFALISDSFSLYSSAFAKS